MNTLQNHIKTKLAHFIFFSSCRFRRRFRRKTSLGNSNSSLLYICQYLWVNARFKSVVITYRLPVGTALIAVLAIFYSLKFSRHFNQNSYIQLDLSASNLQRMRQSGECDRRFEDLWDYDAVFQTLVVTSVLEERNATIFMVSSKHR